MRDSGFLSVVKKGLTTLVLVSILAETGSLLLSRVFEGVVRSAEAAVVVIEPAPSADFTSHITAGTDVVFINDQTGYRFYRASDGRCYYRKTTNGGDSWGTGVVVDNQTDCIGVTVWYDRWTPGLTGQSIHVATMDTSSDHIFYNRLDTQTDTLLLTTSTSTLVTTTATYTSATNRHSITRGTDGVLYVVADDGTGSIIRRCSSNCGVTSSWSAVGTPPQGNADSWSLLMPLASGNIMLINRSTGNAMRSSVWNGTIWSTFTTIDASAIRNTTYDVGFAATVDTDTNDIYLAYVADNDTFTVADHDIRTRVYSGGSWVTRPNLITNQPTRGLLQVAIGRDQNNGDIYLAYTARSAIATTNSVNVYAHRSTDGMNTWAGETGPINTTAGNFFNVSVNLMSYDRLYVTWFDSVVATQDIFGETLANIGPQARITALGALRTPIRTESTNTYLGGSFLLETVATRTVSSIQLSENGTVDGSTGLANLRLRYDVDTTTPFDCASESYSGSEPQFGQTLTNGFSAANGTALFSTTSPVTFGPSQSLCFYLVTDITDAASDGQTIRIFLNNPRDDVVVSGGAIVFPFENLFMSGTTTLVSTELTQTGYHWRNDDGSQTGATSATFGIENEPLPALLKDEPVRLRLGVANRGSTTTLPTIFTLEVGTPNPTCALTSNWSEVGSSTADWSMFASTALVHGSSTTNIPLGSGGVSDSPGSFLVNNQGVRTLSPDTASLTLGANSFVEFEYAIVATSTAVEGQSYCFRLVKNDRPLKTYNHYPLVTIAASVTVGSFGSAIATSTINTNDVLYGGGFSLRENISSRSVQSVRVTEFGSSATGTIRQIRLLYQFDTTSPRDCNSVVFTGTEPLFGAPTVLSQNTKSALFNDNVTVSTSSTLCLMPEIDISDQAVDSNTLRLRITNPPLDVAVSGGGSIGPSESVEITGSTQLQVGILELSGYHWRLNNGSESGATSATGGSQNTPLADFNFNTPIRLRVALDNTNPLASTAPTRFRLEYAPKVVTCNMATTWTDVSAPGDGWAMWDSTFLNHGDSTTNISLAAGGISDPNPVFLSSNEGVRETTALSATTSLAGNQFVELEYSITSTDFAAYSTTYCFRVSANGVALPSYLTYPEITTVPKRDFRVQRGTTIVSGTSTLLTAGVDYTAPASSSRAFVRITNAHQTGAGHNTGAVAAQNAKDVTAHIVVTNLVNNFRIVRGALPIDNTVVDWEIVEFIGNPNTDNEFIVRGVGNLNFGSTPVVATGSPVTSVASSSKVVVFITGASNDNNSRNYFASQFTAEWDATTQSPVLRRGANGTTVANVSYAVVEFTGPNWRVQRVQHQYTVAGSAQTRPITPVNSLDRAFLHVQKRMGATTNVVHYGHEVWLSSLGAVSFQLETGASVVIEQTSVAWVIENTQTGFGAMTVQRFSGNTNAGTAPLSLSINIPTPIAPSNASILATARAAGANTTYPRPNAGFAIASSTGWRLYRSNTGSLLTYRAEVVSWPVSDLSLRQNFYQIYADNGTLTPNDPWPVGLLNLGENTVLTINNNPLGLGERVRLRSTLLVKNANLPANFISLKLQYGQRTASCGALGPGEWFDVGGIGSSTPWRGYLATSTTNGQNLSTDPPTIGDLRISQSDRAGSLVHFNPAPSNPFATFESEDIEYDWHLEQNGANPETVYCFRMVNVNGTPLNAYNFHPQITTAPFTPASVNWRWYSDSSNETPTVTLAAETITPINIANNDRVTLRIAVEELKGVAASTTKFRLQFSEDPNFSTFSNVQATSTCGAMSFWCYAEGGGVDNTVISTLTLTGVSGCTSGVGPGCGTHNTTPTAPSTHVHGALTRQEYSFTIRQVAARVNALYYFRLFDVVADRPVPVLASSTAPTLITEGPTLTLGVSGLPSGTTTAGVTTTVTSNANQIGFNELAINAQAIAAHRLSVTTNATEGYQVLKYAIQPLSANSGAVIRGVAATNQNPLPWNTGCQLSATTTGCIGYHTTDSTLRSGSTRFAPADTYAALSTTTAEVMYSSGPSSDTHDIVYRAVVNELQPAGVYETEIVYLVVPAY